MCCDVISIKQHIESTVEELMGAALESYRSALIVTANFGLAAFPDAGPKMHDQLLGIEKELAASPTVRGVREACRHFKLALQGLAETAVEHNRTAAREIKEIMMIVARAAEAISSRDLQDTSQFQRVSLQLQSIAKLDDLTEIRHAVVRNAAEMRSMVEKVSQERQKSFSRLRNELVDFQNRLNEAERIASLDPLTGLNNRRECEKQLQLRVLQDRQFCMLMFDVNGFKQVNDLYGHLAGDEVLKQLATELKSASIATDLIARWGGDEFVMLIDCTYSEALLRMARIREWIVGDYKIQVEGKNHSFFMETAIGLIERRPGEGATSVLSRADEAMYAQKRSVVKLGA